MPIIPLYDEKTNPLAYVQTYKMLMNITMADVLTLCNAFPLTLFRPAQAWSRRLRTRMISSFGKLKEQFITQFLSSQPQNHRSNYLKTIRQKNGESMREYLEWFDEAILLCPMVSQESILSVIQEGLRPSQFLHKLSRKIPKTYTKLKIKAFFHALADEYVKRKKGKPSGLKKDGKRKEQDVTKDPQQKRGRPEGNHASNSVLKPFISRFKNYTPLNTSRE